MVKIQRVARGGILILAILPAWCSDVRALVKELSLDEKIALVHGSRDPQEVGQAGYWAGLPDRGIPPLRFADGPPGVNVNREATAMPTPVALAATFDVEAARLYGAVMAREAKALQQGVLLTPYVNIVRDPLFRRNHTTLTEDPLLAARIGVAEILAIQKEGVMAQVKHLAGYSGPDNVVIDERTLREIYLPPFEAAVRAAVASVMCAYNRINGDWACGNGVLQNDILRGHWGFQGFVTSDWGALHSAADIIRGTDLEMPGRELAGRRGGPYYRDRLKQAVESGTIPIAALDEAVTRILRQLDRFGYLGRRNAPTPAAIDIERHARIVRGIAESAAVLLKNEYGVLPLKREDLSSVALIGPTAGQPAVCFGGERAYGFEKRLISPLDALRRTAPGAKLEYSEGVGLTGVPISGVASEAVLRAGEERSWSGTVVTQLRGEYTFMIQPLINGLSEGGGSIAIDGQVIARSGGPGFGGTGRATKKWSSLLPTTDGRDNARGTVVLNPGAHRIDFTAQSIGEGELHIRYAWITPSARAAAIAAAVKVASSATTALIFAWSVPGGNSLSLPEDQDDLITRIAAVNPRTVVVLNSGGPVTMPWLGQVRAALEMWYPGQEGGWATANLLLGRVSPSGRLPVTFPVRLEDAPARAAGHPERLPVTAPPGTTGVRDDAPAVVFSEGLTVGYRWYDQQTIEPLFPFGYGLSYTRFEYSALEIKRAAEGAEVAFTIRNTGKMRGAEVAQIYLERPATSPVPMPPKALVGFARVELAAGATRRVKVAIDPRAFSYWATESRSWQPASLERTILVGTSSRDVRLKGRSRPDDVKLPDMHR